MQKVWGFHHCGHSQLPTLWDKKDRLVVRLHYGTQPVVTNQAPYDSHGASVCQVTPLLQFAQMGRQNSLHPVLAHCVLTSAWG